MLFYDGVCGLCNRLVRFLLRFDHNDRFRYATLQSDFTPKILNRHGLNPADLDSVVLISDFGLPTEAAHTKSDAILAAARDLGGIWRLGLLARLLPRPVRNWGYNRIARNRYRIFGRYDSCPLPKPENRVKFVDHIEVNHQVRGN